MDAQNRTDHRHPTASDPHGGHAVAVAGHGGHSEHEGHPAHDEHQTHGEHPAHSRHEGHQQSSGHGAHQEHGGHDGHQEHGGHGGHGGHGDHVGQFRRLFWISLILAVPVVALSPMFAMLLGYEIPQLPGLRWVAPVLGTVLYVWGGRPFLTGAVSEIRTRRPGMMLLIALGITVGFVASWGATIGVLHHELEFWWELALLIVIMLLGHWIEMRSLARTTSALDSLAALLPDEAERVDGDRIVPVAPADLRRGDLVLVRPGASIPADGTIVEGRADVDESMVTGESRPVARQAGDAVVAGTVATDSSLRIEVAATGEETALAGIRRLVSEAQSSSSRAQRIADRAAGWLFWFALGAAVITAVVWTAIDLPDEAVIRTVTVLVIACPHALGLAIPLVVSIATERAARAGVLVTDRLALEAMRTVDTVLVDKTGTLTRGEPVLSQIAATGVERAEVLALAAAAESESEHPLARAVVERAEAEGVQVPRATEVASAPALGVSAQVDGHQVRVGGPRLLEETGTREVAEAEAWRAEGAIILHVLRDGAVIGAFALTDEVRPQSRPAVEALHARGVDVVMVTGDAEAVARSVGDQLGIDRVFAGVRPEDKADAVARLQREGRRVAMVGDGVNDAPALARADVGIAIGAGTDVAIASAGVVLAGSDPRAVLSVIDLSRAAYRKMTQNLWWAAGYNLVSVPLAAGVLAGIGFVLPMSVGAILMSLSTVIVALNAQLRGAWTCARSASAAEPPGLTAIIVLAGLLPACTSAEAPEDPAVMIHLYSGVENPVITVDHRTYEDALACLREAGPGDPATAMGGDDMGFGSSVLEDGAVSYYLGETWATESGGEALTALDGCTEWFGPFHEAATEQLPADVLAHLEETRAVLSRSLPALRGVTGDR